MKKWVFSPFVAAIIFYLSAIKSLPKQLTIDYTHDIVHTPSGKELISLTFCRDTIGHFSLYALLAFVLFFDLKRVSRFSARTKSIITLLAPITFGIMMEFAQKYLFPPRAFEWSDIIANSLGCIMGFWMALRYAQRSAK